jgi:UDP-glucose:(heptosyl)LPS alpha-1,3-glucosyltransferase
VEAKIRFATAILDFSKKKGGAEKYLVDLCARMASEGHEVHVFTERWDEEDPEIHFHCVKTIPFPKSLRLLSFAIRATREIEGGNYHVTLGVGNTLRADVLQPHGGVHWAWFWRSLRAYDHPILWVTKFLGRVLSPKQWISGWIENAPYQRGKSSKIIAISDMVKQDILRWYKIQEDRIVVIYNGVDIERFHPRNRQYREEIRKRHHIGEEIVLLFVSNNFRMKGLSYLIKALSNIKEGNHPSFKLLVLGRDRKEPYLRLANKLGIDEEMVFAGSVKEIEKYYGAADVLVHPSFYDACSLTVLEALASGLPVITTAFNGACGVLGYGESGFILKDPRDIKSISEKIIFFIDEEKRWGASSQARGYAEQFPLEINYCEMMNTFQRVVELKRISNEG